MNLIGRACTLVVLALIAEMAFANSCSFELDNAKKAIASFNSSIASLSQEITQKQQDLQGPLTSAKERAKAHLAGAELQKRTTDLSSALIDQLIPILQQANVPSAAIDQVNNMIAEHIAMQPDIRLSVVLANEIEAEKSSLTADEYTRLQGISTLLDDLETSDSAWLEQLQAVSQTAKPQKPDVFSTLLQSALQLQATISSTKDFDKSEIQEYKADLTKADADFTQTTNEISKLQNQVVGLQAQLAQTLAMLPSLEDRKNSCDEQGGLKFERVPK